MRGEGIALGILVFAVYAAGACRTIYVGDSGELVTAVYVLGIPHPTGYPLYVLLGKLWTVLVPIGSIAFRMSLMSAACAAAACALVHGLCRGLGLDRRASALAALLLAFSPSFWSQANIQRVYALNALFVALATALAFSWYRARRERSLRLAFLACGLGASNHSFMAVYAVALAAFALLAEPASLRRPLRSLRWLLAFAVGTLPYLFLPLRSRADPVLDWGNPETPGAFLDVLLRRDFWGRAWVERPADVVVAAADYAAGLAGELLWAGAVLALAGAVLGRRRGWPVSLPIMVMAGNLFAVALHGSRADIFLWHRYYIPSYLMGAVLAGMGAQLLLERLTRRTGALILLLPAVGLLTGFSGFDRSRYQVAEDFSRKLLDSLPPGARLVANDDNVLFVLMYLHLVEGARPELDLILEGVGGEALPPLRFDPDSDPLFFTHHPNWRHPQLEVAPVGLVFRTVRAGRPPPDVAVTARALVGEDDPRVPKDHLTRNLIGHFHYMLGVSFEGRDWARAADELEAAARAAPDNEVLFYNLGLIYSRNGLLAEAVAHFERAREISPRGVGSLSRAEAWQRLHDSREQLSRLAAAERRLQATALRGVPPGGAAFHRRLSEELAAEGFELAARGHARRALRLASKP